MGRYLLYLAARALVSNLVNWHDGIAGCRQIARTEVLNISAASAKRSADYAGYRDVERRFPWGRGEGVGRLKSESEVESS